MMNDLQHDLAIEIVWVDESIRINLLHAFYPHHQSEEEHKQATSIQGFASVHTSEVRNPVLDYRT